MNKKKWQYMPKAKHQSLVIEAPRPMTKAEIRELDAWLEEMWLKMKHDWMHEWKEWGRLNPLMVEDNDD